MKITTPLLLLLTGVIAFAAGASSQQNRTDLDSHIYRQADARKSTGDWGSIRIYTEEGTPTYGTASMLTAELEFLPGKRLQPPHQHANEEFQYVIAGRGTWTLNGKEIPLQEGDLMYAKPWDMHGIANTGTEPLRFLVIKWNNKGVPQPAGPAQK